MDGVIADTEGFHVAAELQTCRDYGFAINPEDWKGFKGRKAIDIFTYLIDTYGDPSIHTAEELIAHKTEVFIELCRGSLEPINGSLELLRFCKATLSRVHLVTSSNKTTQEFITGHFGITSLFDTIVTAESASQGKPHPEPYLNSIKAANIDAARSLVVEDSVSGIKSGLAAGCRVLAVTTSHTPKELAPARPTHIAHTYDDALSIVKALA